MQEKTYSIKELACTGDALQISMYNKKEREIKKGKHQNLLQPIIPTCLEWLLKEPGTKKAWLFVTAITGLAFFIPKIKDLLFPKKTNTETKYKRKRKHH